ncbi:(S)-ureidoglycine aminohydrolase, cupin domain [Dillenia turbinata]|uniref:(S)-ureidoglycine aminohydrolase, cupin domain n=1 Tax=Dillenia turbinata TaxID=194707 RepID=A0AAN8VUD6_9MAGN
MKVLLYRSWCGWEGEPDKFEYTFPAKDTMYMLKGKVKVYIHGHEEPIELGAGDFAEFPKGLHVTWQTVETAKKYYRHT